jgi:hypothetical protein
MHLMNKKKTGEPVFFLFEVWQRLRKMFFSSAGFQDGAGRLLKGS